MPIQNYIVNLDLYCELLNDYTLCLGPCATPSSNRNAGISMCLVHHIEGATCWRKCLLYVLVIYQIWRKSVCFQYVPCEPQKNIKCWGWPLHLKKLGPPCAPWCTKQVSDAQHTSMVHKVALYRYGAQCSFHKPFPTPVCLSDRALV